MTSNLLQASLHDPAVFDELSADGVTPRGHWSSFIQSLTALGAGELEKRLARAERRIRENGVTYNVYGDPLGVSRPWKIDLVPLLIPADEWRFLEKGVIQRAELLNQVLQDLYGPQKLLASGRLPAALAFANPGFLRPLVGVALPKQAYLHLLAVDLARSPDGQWWVLADRTQAPSGSGYALENRTIVADILPDSFRESNVLRLAPFFRAERETLLSLAQTTHPRIVLLTPGPFNETYFEHAYLARYLGFTLVEGADLTVRDRKVYLKTVNDLQPVDVILRRVDDSFCDPLELRADSMLGVPGLVEAVAAGNVKVVNGLGSGTIETAAMMPFLPGLARHLLGEDAEAAVGGDLVVRARLRAGLGFASSGGCGSEAGVSLARNGTGLWRGSGERGKEAFGGCAAGAPDGVCGTGAGGAFDRASLGCGPFVSAQRGVANLRAEYVERVGGDAGWAGARGGFRGTGGFHAARRAQQGCLGAMGRPGGHLQHAETAQRAGGTAARICRLAEPCGRQSFLAGPLRGASGEHGALAADR